MTDTPRPSGPPAETRPLLQRLVDRVKLLDHVIQAHHASSIMRAEHNVCPVCYEAGGIEFFVQTGALLREATGESTAVPERVRMALHMIGTAKDGAMLPLPLSDLRELSSYVASLEARVADLECRPLVLLTSREVYAKALVDAQVCDPAEAARRARRTYPAGADFVRVRGELRRAEEFDAPEGAS